MEISLFFPTNRFPIRFAGLSLEIAMKKLLLITPLLLTVIAARADIVVSQKMESSILNGDITMKIKGEKGRVDMPGGPLGSMSIVVNGGSGEVSTMMHGQKMVMKMSADQMKAATAKAKEQLSAGAATEKPKATGKTEKVGDWDAEIFEANLSGQPAKIWVAKSFPNADKLKAEMSKLSKSMGQASGDAYSLDIPGMPVKTEINSPIGKMTVTLTKAAEQAVDDKEFVIPADYQSMDASALGK
jgi:hypothetical protein